jgi:hypothetical protein
MVMYAETTVKTDKSIEEVVDATVRTLRRSGGSITNTGTSVQVTDASGLGSFSFMCHIDGQGRVVEREPGLYRLEFELTKRPNTIFWLCLFLGWCAAGLLWLVNVLYLFVDGTVQREFQVLLDRVQNEL